MSEREDSRKEDFVMSGKYAGGEEREEPYEYTGNEESAAKRSLKPVLIAGGGLLVAVIVVLMFLSGSPKSAEKDQLKSIETRLKQIEEKLAKLEWIDTGMARLDRKEKDFAALTERMNQMESSMTRRIDQLGKEAVRPAAKQEPPAAKTEAAAPRPEATPAKPAPAKPAPTALKAEKDSKAKIHVVEKGETLYGIGRRYGIPAEQLFKLNHLSPKDPIRVGQKIVLGPTKAN